MTWRSAAEQLGASRIVSGSQVASSGNITSSTTMKRISRKNGMAVRAM
jgi:hypothetical protein